jgi:hypothetical protein
MVMCRAHWWSVALLAVWLEPTSSFMGTMVGGTISWRLDPQFESNRIIYFKLRTAFDKTDGMDEGSGLALLCYCYL